MIIQEPVQAAIWHCLNHYDYKDAVFLAERLYCEVETDETIFILATCYYRSNLIHQAYWLLKEKARRSPECRFLLAKCAYHLKKYAEAESTLTPISLGELKNFDEIAKEFGEVGCFVLQLIAQICLKTERNKTAVEALRKALKLNPFMWQAFADLCHLGEMVDATSIFNITNTDIFNTCQANCNAASMFLFDNSNFCAATMPNESGGDILIGNQTSNINMNCPTADTESTALINNNNMNYILSTPVDTQQQSTQQNNSNGFIYPNQTSNNNLNTSISILRGNTNSLFGVGNSGSSIITLDDTPIAFNNSNIENASLNTTGPLDGSAGTPYRKQFKYLSTLSPTSPSFGVLPLNSSYNVDNTPVIGAGHTQSNFNITNSSSPPTQTLAEVNQEPKVICKKMKNHVSGIIHRRDPSSNVNKPAVFTQTGNLTPRTLNSPASVAANASNTTVRRSTRLFSNSYSVKENNKSPNITNSKFVQPRSPSRKPKARITKISLNNELIEERPANSITVDKYEKNSKKEKIETITSAASNNRSAEESKVLLNNNLNNAQTMGHYLLLLKKQSADGLMALLRDIGEAYRYLANYQCKAAIKHIETTIPSHHFCSSWIQLLIAIAHYELREYESATMIFKRVHQYEPYRLECMEIYSSSLWHLQKEVDLSALAQDLMGIDKSSPITWCVAGNCFSLHKEHETAIKFFKRAVQVEPDFVYSYTLLGHELVLIEELDKALDYFRAAVVRDPRHYNAWFGIGTIYSKQEKYELAELHYIRALKINSQNSVILVHIGAMQYFMQKKEQALETLNNAAILDPNNPLARFHRGSIYFSLGKHQEALRELEELKEIVPKESVVYYLMGKIHKQLGNVDSALMHFSWATDLDPKGANNQIRDAFDSMSHPACCSAASESNLDAELEPISERSDDSTQAQQDLNYDSDAY